MSTENPPIQIGEKSNHNVNMKKASFPDYLSALQRHMAAKSDTPTDLANRAGVSRDALYKVLQGKTKTPSLEFIIRIAKAYGQTVEGFMGLSPAQIHGGLIDEVALLDPQSRSTLEAALRAQRQAQQQSLSGDASAEPSDATPDPASSSG